MSRPRRRASGSKDNRSPQSATAAKTPSGRRRRRRAARSLSAKAIADGQATSDDRSPTGRPTPLPRVQRSRLRAPASPVLRQWLREGRVLACAALAALGSALGFLFLQRELRLHLLPLGWAGELSAAAVAAGVVFGMWLPRRLVLRRLGSRARDGASTEGKPLHTTGLSPDNLRIGGGAHELEFAASLSGGMIVALGLVWSTACAAGVYLESYRAAIVRDFLLPAALAETLVSAPLLILLGLAAAVGTATLVVLHGWYRLAAVPGANVARLWIGILIAGVLAGLFAYAAGETVLPALGAPLAIFLAGGLAVSGTDHGAPTPAPARAVARTALSGQRSTLAIICAAAIASGAAYSIHGRVLDSSAGLLGAAMVLGTCGVMGIAARRLLLQTRAGETLGPHVALCSALIMVTTGASMFGAGPWQPWLPLAGTSCCAACCASIAGRRIARSCGSTQSALSRIGATMAAGFGAAVCVAPLTMSWFSPSTYAFLTALLVAGVCGAALLLDDRPTPPVRTGGLVVAALALLACPAAWFASDAVGSTHTERSAAPALRGPMRVARELLAGAGNDDIRVRPELFVPPSRAAELWRIDVAGHDADLIVFESVWQAPGDPRRAERLLTRAATRLTRGGRLAIELPADPRLIRAARHVAVDREWREHELTVSDRTGAYHALIYGRDVPEWLARQPTPEEYEVRLSAAPSAADARVR